MACVSAASAQVESERILIVDDDEINRGILDNLFAPFYSVEEAENGKTGLEKILLEP